MHIRENIDNYRVVVSQEDLIQIGKTLEQFIEDLIEASGLVGKPLGDYQIEECPDNSWIIFIQKEKKL